MIMIYALKYTFFFKWQTHQVVVIGNRHDPLGNNLKQAIVMVATYG